MDFLLFALVHLGVVYIVTQSRLFIAPRQALVAYVQRLHKSRPWAAVAVGFPVALLICPACFGFWVGGALQLLGYWPLEAVYSATAEAALAGCVLGALWSAWGPEDENDLA